jgi:hypothetical protein
MTTLAFTSLAPLLTASVGEVYDDHQFVVSGHVVPLSGVLNIKGAASFAPGFRQAACGYVVVNNTRPQTGCINLTDLFPTGPTLAPNNPIDQALVEMAAWNAVAGNTQQRLKVRVSAGVWTPPWMMTPAYGGTVQMMDPTGDSGNGSLQTLPRFWTKRFQDIWYSLMQTLASMYDGNPLIAEIVASPNMVFYCEPGLRQVMNPVSASATANPFGTLNPNMVNLVQAGYRAGSLTDPYTDVWNQAMVSPTMAAMWPNTIVGIDFNPYQRIDITPLTTSTSLTTGVMSPGSFGGFALPPKYVVTKGDVLMVRDEEGNSQNFVAAAAAASGAASVSVVPQVVTLNSQPTYDFYNVTKGSDITKLAWPMMVNASDMTTLAAMIIQTVLTNPRVSLENASYRLAYTFGTGAMQQMYALMKAALVGSGATIGIQTAQHAAINGGSAPTTASMQTIMAALATLGASHVEMFCSAGASNPAYSQYLSIPQVSAAVAAFQEPTTADTLFGVIGTVPPGMTVTPDGLLGGTPLVRGTFEFIPTAINAGNVAVGPAVTMVVR